MSIIESLYDFLRGCPLLKDGFFGVDFLGEEPTEYVVESMPTTDIVKQYADGSALKQYLFIFGSREFYGSDALKNLANSQFYERFASWLKSQSDNGLLPVLEDGKAAQKIEALSTGYVFDGNGTNARYQIQCRLLYFEQFGR